MEITKEDCEHGFISETGERDVIIEWSDIENLQHLSINDSKATTDKQEGGGKRRKKYSKKKKSKSKHKRRRKSKRKSKTRRRR